MRKILTIFAGSVSAVLILIVVLGTWNGSGNVLDLIAGQFEPDPKMLERDISPKDAQPSASYSAQIAVDLNQRVNGVTPEDMPFAVGGTMNWV